MTEFEPCPVTGERPRLVFGCGAHLEFCCPMTNAMIKFTGNDSADCGEFWSQYLTAARKYAEYLESQKPVEFQAGDVVGLVLESLEMLVGGSRSIETLRATVVKIIDDKAMLSQEMFRGDNKLWPLRDLRLISRPAKLTVADLPAPDGYRWSDDINGLRLVRSDGNPPPALKGDDRFQNALDFCNKLTDATLQKRGAAKPEGV